MYVHIHIHIFIHVILGRSNVSCAIDSNATFVNSMVVSFICLHVHRQSMSTVNPYICTYTYIYIYKYGCVYFVFAMVKQVRLPLK